VVAACLVFLAACTGRGGPSNHDETLAAVIAEGKLLSHALGVEAAAFNLYTVGEHNLVREHSIPASVVFARSRSLAFERDGNYFDGFTVRVGQFVNEGDVLAIANHEPTDIQLEQLRQAREAQERVRHELQQEAYRIQAEIEYTKIALGVAGPEEWERLTIRLGLLELDLQQFNTDAETRRRETAEQVEEIERRLGGEEILAPFDGVIASIATAARVGNPVIARQQMLVIDDVSSLMLRAAPVADPRRFVEFMFEWEVPVTLRYGNVVPVTVMGHTFDVRVANDPFTETLYDNPSYFLTLIDPGDIGPVLEEVDHNWQMVRYFSFNVDVTNYLYGGGMQIPFQAIHHDVNRPYVLLYDDGFAGRRYITQSHYFTVGLFDLPFPGWGRVYWHVLCGVEPGQRVILPRQTIAQQVVITQ
jgi:biotin carboxyl carrier protein